MFIWDLNDEIKDGLTIRDSLSSAICLGNPVKEISMEKTDRHRVSRPYSQFHSVSCLLKLLIAQLLYLVTEFQQPVWFIVKDLPLSICKHSVAPF